MPDIWFVFTDNGELLFKTEDERKTNLNTLPINFNATYVVKNPKVNQLAYTYKYNISTKRVDSITEPNLENTNSTELNSTEIHNYVEKINEFSTKILTLQLELQQTVEELTRTKNEVTAVSTKTNVVTTTVDSVFTNVE